MAEQECFTIDMSDSPLGSSGAMCVSKNLKSCKNLKEIQLANCEIKDTGAKVLFEEL